MPLETATLISDLDATNPAHTDQLNQADAHLRLIKGALKNTFPSINAAVSATDEDLNALHTGQIAAQDGAGGTPSITFKNNPTAGFRSDTATPGHILIEGTLRGAGAVPVGAIVDFPKTPVTLGSEWLECDGSAPLIANFPELAAFLGTTFGGDGVTTFGLPNLTTLGRFRRSRSPTLGFSAGTYQAHAIRNHTHSGTVDAGGGHTPIAHATVTDPGHTHNYTAYGSGGYNTDAAAGATAGSMGTTSSSQTGISVSVSVDAVAAHTHTFSTGVTGDDTETRPVSFVVVTCIKA